MGRHAERFIKYDGSGRSCRVTDPGQWPRRPLRPGKMLKNGLHRVTANRGQPDASDLRAAAFRRDRLHVLRKCKDCATAETAGAERNARRKFRIKCFAPTVRLAATQPN